MKILVTGGAGYIGSHTILEVLEKTSWDAISADSFLRSSPLTLERIKNISGKQIKNYNFDLCDFKKIKTIFSENADIKGIIHFAALKSVPESVSNPELYYRNNNESLKNILACIKEFGIKNFIFSSSCSVYGNIDTLPVNEESPLQKAQSPYAETKQEGERIITEFSKKNPDIYSIALRYFNPAGAHLSGLIGEAPLGKPDNIVPSITQTAIGKLGQFNVFGNDYDTRDGSCIRDYIHVSDIAYAHVLALQALFEGKIKNNFEIINLGTGNGITVLEAIKAFEKVSEKKLNYKIAPRRSGDVEAIYSDSSKAKKILGWTPKYNIEKMMETAWKWQLHLSPIPSPKGEESEG
ncbi:MAG: UDP-glucose 4-epimerase GalE [Bacteroidetes bacterium]|nr:UDP-glucose 4-epimerase GalE [Bacteroidota bacterium]